ncbi:MAG: hypothetical protein MJ007_02090 [Paludibacteraceae bacterium]|nr:hypothetical protein [Paludibacteraceae bacterium]
MANSLRCKIKRLVHTGAISNDEYDEIMDKLAGHDRTVAFKAVDAYVEYCLRVHRETRHPLNLKAMAERFKEQK